MIIIVFYFRIANQEIDVVESVIDLSIVPGDIDMIPLAVDLDDVSCVVHVF